jgi:high affinity sulfate transporter 1
LVTGVVFLAAGLARLGFITQFLSKPVMDGFVLGLAIFVVVGQLNKLFGVPKPEGNTVEKLVGILKELPQANWVSFAVGATALALLFLLPRWNKKVPGGLVVLFGAIGLSAALDLHGKYGVEIVGTLPQGLPSFAFPRVPFTTYLAMVVPAIGVLLVAYSEALGVAQEFAEKHGYEVDPNQELNAHAGANLVSAVFGGMIAGGGMSSSAVKEGAGARTQVSNLVTWVATIITVLFLTPLFAPLPEAVLGALIIHALWHILVARKLQKVRLAAPVEFWFGVLALAGVLFVDVLQGMIVGVAASLLFVVYESSRPHVSIMGRVPGVPGAYSDLTIHPENIAVPGVLILRVDGQLYYANALTLRDRVRAITAKMEPPPRAVILDSSAWYEIDVTSSDTLKGMVNELHKKGNDLYLAEVHTSLLESGRKTGLLESIGEDHVFSTVELAVRAIEAKG